MAHDKNSEPTNEDVTPAIDENTAVKEGEVTSPETPSLDDDVNAQNAEKQTEGEAAAAEVAPPDEAEAATASDPSAEIIEQLQADLAATQQESTKNLENWQRTAAELANYKRRQEEQMKLQRDRIKSEVLEGVISALDDLDLAFQNLPEELDGQLIGWVEGFRLVQRKLDKILDDQNVMPVDTSGQFDPNFHEAVSYEQNDDHETDHIIAELRKGYQIGNRVIRPALVRVAQ
ncbi:MAG: nucleotide exchange factor GrpE [Anaerolineae bacterium]|nr:nucleotide exchange factor GrpE [Anaerolineae bacterium]